MKWYEETAQKHIDAGKVDCSCTPCKAFRNSELHKPKPKNRTYKPRSASRSEQYARYIDCGPGAWDDR